MGERRQRKALTGKVVLDAGQYLWTAVRIAACTYLFEIEPYRACYHTYF